MQDKLLYGKKIYLVILSYLGWLEKFIAFFSAFMDVTKTGNGERGAGNAERKSGNELSAETSIKIKYGR